jgi:hypothetical protein
MKEIWKDIPNYEGLYKISNFGNIKRYIKTQNKWKNKKITENKDGYYITSLSKNGKKKVYLIHRLVAETFIPDKNKYKLMLWEEKEKIDVEKLQINHIDENKKNNFIGNLEWCTNLYNVNYSNKKRTLARKNKNLILKKEIINLLKKENVNNKIIKKIEELFYI